MICGQRATFYPFGDASQQVSSRAHQPQEKSSAHNTQSAIRLAQEGLYGKACQVFNSSGIAHNNDSTWQLLKSKDPNVPLPIIPPNDMSDNQPILSPHFNILSILKSFPKATASGPSGLQIQHLLDAAEFTLQTPICSSLKGIVNLLASGKVPKAVSKFITGDNLVALSNDKPGSPPDIRPIAVGETLKRLVSKCLCQIVKGRHLNISLLTNWVLPVNLGLRRWYMVYVVVLRSKGMKMI